MKHSVLVVYGQEQVKKVYSRIKLNQEEEILNKKEYFFNTKLEKEAFCKGICEAIGWLEYCIPEEVFEKS